MLKKITNGAGLVLAFVSMATLASAGSLAESAAEPVVEDLVIEESQPTSGAWIPIALGLVAVAAVIASSSSDDDGNTNLPENGGSETNGSTVPN